MHSAFVFQSREKQPFINHFHPPPFSEIFQKSSFPQSRGEPQTASLAPQPEAEPTVYTRSLSLAPATPRSTWGRRKVPRGQGCTRGSVPTCVPQPSWVRELTTRLVLRDANPSRKGDFKTRLGSPCSTVVGAAALHTSIPSFTACLHGESCLQNPQACVLCFLCLRCVYVSRWQLRHLWICSHGSLPAVESFECQI